VARGYIHIEDACDQLSLNREDIRALVARGELTANGQEVSRASVERYAASRQRRFGALAVAAVRHVRLSDDAAMNRIMNAAAVTVGSESVGADGGFAVPASYSDRIFSPFFGGFNLPAMTERITTPSNNIEIPADRKPPHDETSGVTAYWVDEGAPIPQSKPAFEAIGSKLRKLAAIVPVSEELLQDSPALGAYLEIAGAEAIIWKATYEIVQGIGGAMPLGMLNSSALISIAAESGPQTADTIVGANVAKMYARMPANSLPTAIWLVHPDALAQLIGINVNGQLAYTNGDDEAPAGRLLGRPIVPTEACEAVGDVGDILFVDPKQYLTVTKDPAMRTLTSLHIWFERDLLAFRFSFRMAGAPMWAAPVASRVGGNTRSPFICLAAR
jgi:HK97 family phage major capsid protein